MARIRRSRNWVSSGPVGNFLPDEVDTEEREEEYWDGTIQHLTSLAAVAAGRAHCSLDYHQRRDLALSAVSMILAEAPDTPTGHIVQAAQMEVLKESTTITRSHGLDTVEGGFTPRFVTYWLDFMVPVIRSNYRLSEMTLHKVWEGLTDQQQETLLGRTVTYNNTELGEVLGVHSTTAAIRLREARRAAQELWFDWETAPPLAMDVKRKERTHCPSGHDLDEHGVLTKKVGKRTYRCRECDRKAYWTKKKRKEEAA